MRPNGLFVVALPSLISSSVVKRIGSGGGAGSAARIACERARPESGGAAGGAGRGGWGRSGGADRLGEVALDERVDVGVVGLQVCQRLVGVDAAEPEQRG